MEISSPNLDIILKLLKTLLKRANSTELRITNLYKHFFGNDINRRHPSQSLDVPKSTLSTQLDDPKSTLSTQLDAPKSTLSTQLDIDNQPFGAGNELDKED